MPADNFFGTMMQYGLILGRLVVLFVRDYFYDYIGPEICGGLI